MRYIAHRGLYDGPDINLENHPEQIQKAISKELDCEIDLWVEKNENNFLLFLGHDFGQYQISAEWLKNKPLWIHAKNIEALEWLNTYQSDLNYFWHQNDDFTLTSHGYIWTYPGKKLTHNSICVQPEWNTSIDQLTNFNQQCYGVCSKYISHMRV